MKTEWFYAEENAQKGPVSVDELKGLRAMGKITDATLVWYDGMTDWKPLSEALAAADSTPAPAPPANAPIPAAAGPVSAPAGGVGAMQPAHSPGMPMATEPPAIGEATTSLVLGILSVICFGLLTAIPGAIFGHIALKKIRLSNGALGGKGLAVAGLILSYIGLAFSVIAIIFYVFLIVASVGSGSY